MTGLREYWRWSSGRRRFMPLSALLLALSSRRLPTTRRSRSGAAGACRRNPAAEGGTHCRERRYARQRAEVEARSSGSSRWVHAEIKLLRQGGSVRQNWVDASVASWTAIGRGERHGH